MNKRDIKLVGASKLGQCVLGSGENLFKHPDGVHIWSPGPFAKGSLVPPWKPLSGFAVSQSLASKGHCKLDNEIDASARNR